MELPCLNILEILKSGIKTTKFNLSSFGIVNDHRIVQWEHIRNKVMLEFNSQNYQSIKSACQSKNEIEFWVERSATVFRDSDAPEQWTAYPPAYLPPSGYAQVFAHSGNDKAGALTRLELTIHLDNGRVLYKKRGDDEVCLKVTWPENA